MVHLLFERYPELARYIKFQSKLYHHLTIKVENKIENNK